MGSSRGVLPTRKNRTAKSDAADVGSIEARQMTSTAGDRQSAGGEEARVDNIGNNKTDTTTKQAFVMDDIPTIDTSTMPPAYERNSPSRRGASPSIITSRRGRSRSPVGYNNPSPTSRSSSRNGSSGRPLSRNDISSAAFAAGEAAAGVMDPYARQQSHHPQLMHARARSPSPVNRFPALDLSFEVSPQQSMSFIVDGSSFDWNAGSQQDASATGRRSPSPPQQHQYHHNHYGGRSSSPLQRSRAASRNSQALFPEHQILSSRSREYFGTLGGNGTNNNRGERRTIRSPSPNPNRSSVFRGSPSGGSAANRLPAELMLALDDTPPSSPVPSSKQKKSMERQSNQSAAAVAAANIDKELSATHDFENIQFDGIMGEGDYLANLSLRKSYDLEQVFSFMNENKEDNKDGSRDPMRLGTASFANFTSTLMCNSNEVGDKARQQHPVIQSIASQNSNIGLTPIHSFKDAQEVDQVDGDELGRFLQNAPIMQEGGPAPEATGGQYWSYNQASSAPAPMHTQTPPSYNNVYPEDTNANKYSPSSGPAPPLPTLENSSLATATQSKVSTRHTVHPMINLSCKSDFFVLLRKMAPAFMGFRFTLPEMNQPATEPEKPGSMYRPNEGQLMIARRRVNSSVCAFGGVIAHRAVSFDTSREEVRVEVEEKRKYDENLSMRYFMKENCVSWDVELHDVIKPSAKKAKVEKSKAVATASPKSTVSKDPLNGPYCAPVTPKSPHASDSTISSKNKDGEKKAKTKYRCKLCGLPKQNHTCAYKKNVVRSIGTQVYPVVNAFVSNEPGLLAPALSEMNNFTSMLSQDTSTAPVGHLYRMPYSGYNGPITPDSHWSPTTPGGLSTMSSSDPATPRTPHSPYNNNNFRKRDYSIMSRTMTHTSTPGGYSPRQSRPQDAMFRETMPITMEQFRTVRVKATEKVLQPYQYPLVPTPYDQRKEMGDTLFALSKEVPSLADSCASILREAREKDEWDQAVAELTTQVLVVLKCEEDDYSLEGLMRHLNGLGIAC